MLTNLFGQDETPVGIDSQFIPTKECRSHADSSAIEYEESVNRSAFQQLLQDYMSDGGKNVIIQYATQIHIVTRDDGTGGVDINDIRGEFDDFINPYFADIDVEFVECSPELYHNSTEYYILGNDDEDADVAGDAMSVAFNVADVINIYYVSDPDGACGWARFPWKLPSDYIVMANSCADNQSTTVHELGHYFGLYHTHESGLGAESVTRDDTDGCWDCEDDGDLLCDTPADPNLSDLANDWPSCAYMGVGTDACNGHTYNPAIDNIMSYADKKCRTIFSGQQRARMEIFRDGDRSYLQTGCPCDQPVALCQNITVDLDNAGNASIDPSDVDDGSTWDCGLQSWSVSPNTFDCGDVGGNQVTLTVIDDLGWESSCESTVTIADVTDPEITTSASDMTVECDGGGNIAEFTTWLNDHGGAIASDACGGDWSNSSGGLSDGCGATGFELVTFTYTDPSGNSASSGATFTIEDNTEPDLVCPEDIHLPECVETAEWTVIASDVCGGVIVVSDPPSGSVFPKGTTTVVTVTVTDDCNNQSECTFEVTRDPDLMVDIDPLDTSPLNTCAAGTDANIVIGYGDGPTCVTLNAVGSGGHDPYTYAWAAPDELPEGAFTDDDTASPQFCADFQLEPCVYYTFMVTITDIHGCTEISVIEVNVVNPLCQLGNNPKVYVCHRHAGNSLQEQTICISSNAVDNHLNNPIHEDCLGECDAECVFYSPLDKNLAKLQKSDFPGQSVLTVQPNPFSTHTLISFETVVDTRVRLVILDITGQEVETLFNGSIKMNTPYSFTWDAGMLPAGTYIAYLRGGEGVNSHSTMILIR